MAAAVEIITVTAEDGETKQEWSVAVYNAEESESDILHFILPEQTGHATIDLAEFWVEIEVASGTDLSMLTPTIILPDGATSSPASGTTGDYTPVVTITVTAQGGSTTQDWKIIVTEVGNPRRTEADILSFSFPEQAGFDPASKYLMWMFHSIQDLRLMFHLQQLS